MSLRLFEDERSSSSSSIGGGGFQGGEVSETTRDGEGSDPGFVLILVRRGAVFLDGVAVATLNGLGNVVGVFGFVAVSWFGRTWR